MNVDGLVLKTCLLKNFIKLGQLYSAVYKFIPLYSMVFSCNPFLISDRLETLSGVDWTLPYPKERKYNDWEIK